MFVYALTDLMDRNRFAIVPAILCSGLGLYLLYTQNDWFGASVYLPSVKYILGGYFILSLLVSGWFVIKHGKEDRLNPVLAG